MTMTGKPLGPKDMDCPQWRKPMVKVCHKCPWWEEVRGLHPQTGQEIAEWRCAVSLIALGQFEIARFQRSTQAAVESLRNVVAVQSAAIARSVAIEELAAPARSLLEG